MSWLVGPAIPGVTEVDLDGLMSVFSPATREVLMLNGTASDVWRLADGDHTADELVSILARAYDVEECVVAQDVRDTVALFVAAKLLAADT